MIWTKKRWGETMLDDPWRDLTPPNLSEVVSARRVNAEIPWNFFWGLDRERKHLLILKHPSPAAPKTKLPRLRDIEVTEHSHKNDNSATLAFKLLDPAQREVFHSLCLDIVESASHASSEREAVQIALSRTWRWHHLLRGGNDGRLTAEEQKGMIGELLVIERLLLPSTGPTDAMAAWQGPLGAPKDFELGTVCIEAKAHGGAARPFITISSEYQLDESSVDALFLYVADVTRAPSDGGSSLSEIAVRLRDLIWEEAPAVEKYDQLLEAAGFRWSDDYSDTRWLEGPGSLYRVAGAFPRITARQIPPGVTNVRYSLSTSTCQPYLVGEEELTTAIRRPRDVG